jgi:hypothetical protein
MNNKFLPIGTIILLKDAKKRLMITGFCMTPKEDQSVMYDYCGCVYPEGIVDHEQTILFNHDQIDKIYHMGLSDQEDIEFKNKLNDVLKNMKNGVLVQNNVNLVQNNSVQPQMFSNSMNVQQ